MREAEREEGMRVTERTKEIRWTKDMNNRIRFSLLRYIFSLNERVLFSHALCVCEAVTAKRQKFRSFA